MMTSSEWIIKARVLISYMQTDL